MDVVLDEVDKEVTKVKKLVKEVNEGLVLVYIHGDSRRGYHKKSCFRMIWCWTRRLTWRSTRRLTRRWPTLSTSWWFRSFGFLWGYFICEICGEVFTPASNLRKHIVTTMGRNH